MKKNGSKLHALNSISEPSNSLLNATPSSAVTLSTSSSELKLLRVLHSLHSLCGESLEESSSKRTDVGMALYHALNSNITKLFFLY